MRSVKELIDKRAELVSEALEILKVAEAEDRALSASENRRYTQLESEIDELSGEIEGKDCNPSSVAGRMMRLSEFERQLSTTPGPRQVAPLPMGLPGDRKRRGDSEHVTTFENLGDGSDVYMLSPQASVAELYPSRDELQFGRAVMGAITGKWHSDAERLSLIQTGGSGSFTVNPEMSAQIIDLARAKSTVFAAGAMTVPMNSNELIMARLASDPAAHWRREGVDIPISTATFDAIHFHARTLAVLVGITVELSEDAPNAWQMIQQACGTALGQELDRAALLGEGTNEPVGLLNAPAEESVNSRDLGGSPLLHADVSHACQQIWAANGAPNALIHGVRTRGELDRKLDGEGQPLMPIPSFAALSKFDTSKIPENLGGGDRTVAFVGDFSQLLVGMRTEARLEIFREGSTTELGSAMQRMLVYVRIYLRADVHRMRGSHFTNITGIGPAE